MFSIENYERSVHKKFRLKGDQWVNVPLMYPELNINNPNLVYIAQTMTGVEKQQEWIVKLKSNILKVCPDCYIVDPYHSSHFKGTYRVEPEILVKLDILVVYLCKVLIVDLTKGASVGATTEVNHAFMLNKPIISVFGDKLLSPFSQYMSTKILPPQQVASAVVNLLL